MWKPLKMKKKTKDIRYTCVPALATALTEIHGIVLHVGIVDGAIPQKEACQRMRKQLGQSHAHVGGSAGH